MAHVRATEANGGDDAGGEEAAVGEKRARGERGGRLSKQARTDADQGDAAGPQDAAAHRAAPPTASAEDAVRQERAALVNGLRGEPKRFALRALEQLSNARGRLLDAIEEGRGSSNEEATLDALECVARGSAGWLRGLADDIERTTQAIRRHGELSNARHEKHDARQGRHGSAAVHMQRVVRIVTDGGRGSGGGSSNRHGSARGGKGGRGKGKGGKGFGKGGRGRN
jgi:hypothetical protein